VPNIIKPMYIQQLREMVPLPSHNTVGVCNQIIPLILYYISSTLVTFLKSLKPLYKSLIFLISLLVSSSSILAFRYSFFLFLKCVLASFDYVHCFVLDPVPTAF